MAAPTRPLTSTAVLAGAMDLRCPGPDRSAARSHDQCGRLLGRIRPSTAGITVLSLTCPRCRQCTMFEVPACG